MKNIIFCFLFLFLFLDACGTSNEKIIAYNEIFLTTADEVNISAEYNEVANTLHRAVLLVPMLGHDKSAYENLSQQLQQNGFTVLAIDLRGHGNSDLDYTQFTEADWQNLVLDVQAGVDFLEAKGYGKIAVIGASIGANAALKQAVQDPRIDAVVLLSAGEDYHGLKTLDIAEFYDRPVLFVASFDDKEAAVAATKIYNAVNTEYKEIKLYQTAGHGTDILQNQDSSIAMIITWLWNYY